MLFLGIDVGTTKTHALLCDEAGNVRAFGVGSSGNPEVVGYDGLIQAMRDALNPALKEAGVDVRLVRAAGFGIAGYDWPADLPATMEAVRALGLDCPLVVENDAVPGLWAGSSQGWGIVASAGTGNNVRGLTMDGRTGRITGNSIEFGEFGGAGEIVFKAIQQVTYMWTKRGPDTDLADVFMRHCGAKDLFDLMEGLVRGRYKLHAAQAPLVFRAADNGDAVALEVVEWSAAEMGESVLAVARQLELVNVPFEVVMAGSLFPASAIYRRAFEERVGCVASRANFVLLNAPPVTGAVLMGMHAAGMDTAKIRADLLRHFEAFKAGHAGFS
jgi:N-acetylglucosamine kinase-like BadF-type ATPase